MKVKIYHVETQEDYDHLMIELEKQGYEWINGDRPTSKSKYWGQREEDTIIFLNDWKDKRIAKGSLEAESTNPTFSRTPIVKYKAKETEKIVLPEYVADYLEEHYGGITEPSYWSRADLIRNWSGYIKFSGNLKAEKWAKDEFNFISLVQAIIANDYEVEKEEKFYWRKKEEYLLDFEKGWGLYLNFDESDDSIHFTVNKFEGGYLKTKFTEVEVINLIGKDDFERLEKVEIGVG